MWLARFFAKTDIVLRGHILNWFWRDKKCRRVVRGNVIANAAGRVLKKYLSATAAVAEQHVVHDDANEKIWTIWLQGEKNAPPLVQACWRSVRKNCKQKLIILDANSVRDYIDLPDIIWDKYQSGKIGHAHFADICRVELLYKYGGVWLDSTGFATAPIPDWIINQDFFVYLVNKNSAYGYSFMQNCFIRARRGAYLLAAWRAMILDYWMHENYAVDYFMHQLLFKIMVQNDPRAKKYFAQMPHVDQSPTHALWWAYGNKPFNQNEFDKITSGAWFQKTSFKNCKNIVPGSYADVMINKMYTD